jgi:cyanophycinase
MMVKILYEYFYEGEMMKYGNLIIIGGAEDKKNECEILKEVVQKSKQEKGPIVLLTAATKLPKEVSEDYKTTFSKLGYNDVKTIDVKSRKDVNNIEYCNMIENCSCVFFTGGDQLKITSLLGGTNLYNSLKKIYLRGTLIVGTSAGASCLCTTMTVSGIDEEAPKKCTIKMAPGLDLISGVLIDQHFAQRGRIGRLLNAVAQNPGILGIGIDENTSVNFESDSSFTVLGSGAVTIVDGRNISHTNVSELSPDEILAITDIRIHILPKGYGYDLEKNLTLLKKNEEDKNENN